MVACCEIQALYILDLKSPNKQYLKWRLLNEDSASLTPVDRLAGSEIIRAHFADLPKFEMLYIIAVQENVLTQVRPTKSISLTFPLR